MISHTMIMIISNNYVSQVICFGVYWTA